MNSEDFTGLVCGAESISNLVEEKLGRQIAHDYPNRTWVLDRFRRQFDELYKKNFGEYFSNDKYNFDIESRGLESSCELTR
jgi:hypothetical protein